MYPYNLYLARVPQSNTGILCSIYSSGRNLSHCIRFETTQRKMSGSAFGPRKLAKFWQTTHSLLIKRPNVVRYLITSDRPVEPVCNNISTLESILKNLCIRRSRRGKLLEADLCHEVMDT